MDRNFCQHGCAGVVCARTMVGMWRSQNSFQWVGCPSAFPRQNLCCYFCSLCPCTPGWLLDYPPVSLSPLFTGLLVLKVHDHIQIFTWILGFNLGGWACVAIAFTCWAVSPWPVFFFKIYLLFLFIGKLSLAPIFFYQFTSSRKQMLEKVKSKRDLLWERLWKAK